ncbi:MAG: DEAD/DEAH box helicase family protein, partial [Chloroflexota bacterium]|nr:DEAD/DEAH box helicase family protein [Chloroflexota bacterium]
MDRSRIVIPGNVMDHRQLLRELEIHYPGLAVEYDNQAHGVFLDNALEDEDDDRPNAHLRLRSAETVPSLFGYQQELVTAIERVCSSSPGANIGLVALPTGAGKTRTAAVALLRLLASHRASVVLWLAPTRELLEQACAT